MRRRPARRRRLAARAPGPGRDGVRLPRRVPRARAAPSPGGHVRLRGRPEHEAVETLVLEAVEGGTMLTQSTRHDSVEARDMHVATGMESGIIESYERLDEVLAPTVGACRTSRASSSMRPDGRDQRWRPGGAEHSKNAAVARIATKVVNAAYDAFGSGLHEALVLSGCLILAGAVVAAAPSIGGLKGRSGPNDGSPAYEAAVIPSRGGSREWGGAPRAGRARPRAGGAGTPAPRRPAVVGPPPRCRSRVTSCSRPSMRARTRPSSASTVSNRRSVAPATSRRAGVLSADRREGRSRP